MVAKSRSRTTLKPWLNPFFVAIYRGIKSFQGFLNGAGFRPSTVGPPCIHALFPFVPQRKHAQKTPLLGVVPSAESLRAPLQTACRLNPRRAWVRSLRFAALGQMRNFLSDPAAQCSIYRRMCVCLFKGGLPSWFPFKTTRTTKNMRPQKHVI